MRRGCKNLNLVEGRGGFFFALKDFKEVEKADHFQGLHREIGGLDELQGAAFLLGGSLRPDEEADAAGVDHGDFSEVDHEAVVAGVEGLLDGTTEGIDGFPQSETATQTDYLNSRLFKNRQIQPSPRTCC